MLLFELGFERDNELPNSGVAKSCPLQLKVSDDASEQVNESPTY